MTIVHIILMKRDVTARYVDGFVLAVPKSKIKCISTVSQNVQQDMA